MSAASNATGIEGLEKSIPLVVCDVADPDSLVKMAKTTRLVNTSFTFNKLTAREISLVLTDGYTIIHVIKNVLRIHAWQVSCYVIKFWK